MSDYLFSTDVLKSVGDSIRSLDGTETKMKASQMADRYNAITGYKHPTYGTNTSYVFATSMSGSEKKAVFNEPWMIRAAKGCEEIFPYFYVVLYVTTNVQVANTKVNTLITSNKYISWPSTATKYTGIVCTPSKATLSLSTLYTTEIVDGELVITFDSDFADADYDVYAICFKMNEGTKGTFTETPTYGTKYAIDEEPFENLYDAVFTGQVSECKVPLNQLGEFIKFYNRKFPYSNSDCIDGELVKASQSTEETSFTCATVLTDEPGGLFRYTDGSSETSGDYTKCWDKVFTIMFEQEPCMAGANRISFGISSNNKKTLNGYYYGYIVRTSGTATQALTVGQDPQEAFPGTCRLVVDYPKHSCDYRNNTYYRTGTNCDYITLTIGIGRKDPPVMFDFSVYNLGE